MVDDGFGNGVGGLVKDFDRLLILEEEICYYRLS
jgi:hypothetical protein